MRWMKSDMRSASLRLAVPTGGPAFGCLRPASVSGGGSFARCAGDAGLKTQYCCFSTSKQHLKC